MPDAAYNATRNEYLVAYTHDINAAGTLYGIKGKIVPADLSSIPSNEIRYVVTWRLAHSGTWDVFARILKAGENTPSGGEFPISYIDYGGGGGFFIADGQQKSPAVACGASGSCLVAYEDNCCLLNTGNDYEIRGKLLSANFLYLPLINK